MRKVEFLYMFFCRLMAVILPAKKCVLFCSFYGKYSDNPRYISKELSLSHPDMKQIWVVSDIHENQTRPAASGRRCRSSFVFGIVFVLSEKDKHHPTLETIDESKLFDYNIDYYAKN